MWLLATRSRRRRERDTLIEGLIALLPQLTRTIEESVGKNPLGTIALCVVLGMFAARSPSILAELMAVLLRSSGDGAVKG